MAPGFVRTSSNIEGENPGVTAIAVDMGKNSHFAVKWATDNLLKKGDSSSCILVHVHHKPAPNQNPNGPSKKELQQLFLPFRGFCARKGIKAQEVLLFDTDIAKALLEFIAKNSVATLVIGATNKSAFSRKFWSVSLSTTLLQAAPDSCSVYVISKGKLQSLRLANQPPPHNHQLPPPSPDQQSEVMSVSEYSYSQGSFRSELSSDRMSVESSESAGVTRMSANRGGGGGYGRTPAVPSGHHHQGRMISRLPAAESAGMSNFSDASSASSLSSAVMTRNFQYVDAASYESNNNSTEFSGLSASSTSSNNSSENMQLIESEIRRMKLELQKNLDAYHSICKDAATANQMMTKPQNFHSRESESDEDSTMSLNLEISTPEIELQRNKAARISQLLSEMEGQKKQNAEIMRANYKQALRDKNHHNSRSTESLAYYGGSQNPIVQFREYNIQDIEMSTNHFAPSKKIGEGGYGPVYKGIIDDVPVAIKVVRPDLSQGQKQFQKEVEVLSTVRHPHMVNLLGACPQYGCLVYEYMDNGSLEDRLMRKDNTPTIPWSTRFKIASEIATGLLYLHEHRPEPIVHRDLKPANILLDSNYVSKIGDVGLARLVPGAAPNSNVTRYHMTAAAGTFCYIDPEYQQTGLLSVKSDLFSLGVVLLQLITGKPPMGLSYHVEEAVENERFATVLDPTVKDWPVEEALSLAKLALQCCELRKKDRPSLGNVVLPELNRLRDFAVGFSLGCPEDMDVAPPHYNEELFRR
ncbi:unnamed protein product [Linum tenue]|uniref:Protein kinase domain-containing protein n=1 Tax=Linum tenue TaxID=586396 RepID=A0AAV0KCY7_9ROSI|nr:unnamed protein product [Linum tenue]